MSMQAHQWYLLTFRSTSEHLYFYSVGTMLKNGKMQGWQIEIDPGHPRRQPRMKVVSVHPRLDTQWRPVAASQVPEIVRQAIVRHVAVTRLGDRRRGDRPYRAPRPHRGWYVALSPDGEPYIFKSAPDPRDWPEQYGPFVSHSAAEAMRRRLGPGEPSMPTGSHRARMLASGFGGRARTRRYR